MDKNISIVIIKIGTKLIKFKLKQNLLNIQKFDH